MFYNQRLIDKFDTIGDFHCDANDDIDQTIRTHAVRIAKYLYPNAYLAAASAVLLGPMRDGRLFLTGRRVQRQRIMTHGPGRGDIQDTFEQNLARIFATVSSRLPTVVRKHHCPRAN